MIKTEVICDRCDKPCSGKTYYTGLLEKCAYSTQ